MSVRTNILLRKFGKCTFDVLLRTYCLCLYDIALWHSYSRNGLNKFPSYYNRCIKIFLGYKRHDSLTSVILDTGLPSFNTVLHNSSAILLSVFYHVATKLFLYLMLYEFVSYCDYCQLHFLCLSGCLSVFCVFLCLCLSPLFLLFYGFSPDSNKLIDWLTTYHYTL